MEKSSSIDRQTLQDFWKASLKHKKLLGLSLLHPVSSICLNVLTPLYIGKSFALLSNPASNHLIYAPELIAFAIIGVICHRIGFTAVLSLQAYVASDLQAVTLNGLLKRSVGFHNNNIGGKLVSDAIDYPSAYGTLENALFVNLIPLGIMLLVGTLVIFSESWVLGLFILGMVSFAFGSAWFESRKRSPIRMRRLKASKAVTGHMADTILNVQTIKTFASEKSELLENNSLNISLRNTRLKDWRGGVHGNNNRIAVLLTLQLLFIGTAIYMVEHNPALLGIGIFAFSFTVTLSNRLIDIGIMLRGLEDGFLQASPMTEILHQGIEVVDRHGARDLKPVKGAIKLSNVTFTYDDTDNAGQVFNDLTLDIKPGEKIGLVGPSGGGKSTLTRLLLRFEDIDSGSIAIDGQNIAEITQVSLRRAISYVPQEPLLFHRTVRENIAYADQTASDEQVIAAARKAHAHEFIERLPEGYATIVGERGVKLSGGQRQRIAIARAILKDAPILVLDEATSALDSGSEALIQDALWKLMEQRTAIVVAHRLSTIQKMDRIIVLENGTISEQGSHAVLLKQKGTYAGLWTHQSGGFLKD